MEIKSHAGGHAHHFPSLSVQRYAERFGMWLFLSTEILLFSGLFLAYSVYRFLYPDTFREGSHLLSVAAGTINTVILITSSFTVVMALHSAKENKSRRAAVYLFVSILFAVAFLGVKATEYLHHIHEGALPGKYYTFQGLQGPGASMFYTIYFFVTGLHAFHVIIGMGVLAWAGVKAWKNQFSAAYYTPVELGGLYWHLVDLVWIFLYPLLYLI